jgi:S1-C subfamily serine protease
MNRLTTAFFAIILMSISFSSMSDSSVISIKKTASSTTNFERFTQASPKSEFAFELSIDSIKPEKISIQYTYNHTTQTAYETTSKAKEVIIFPSVGKHIALEKLGLHIFNIKIGNEVFERTIQISEQFSATYAQTASLPSANEELELWLLGNIEDEDLITRILEELQSSDYVLNSNYIPKNEDIGYVNSYEVQDTRSIGSVIYKMNASSTPLIINSDSIGTGSVVTSTGQILTNWHVVQDANTVQVAFKPKGFEKLDASQFYIADIIKINEEHDLALLQLRTLPKNIRKIPLASESGIEVAMDVHAIGHPKGNLWTYTNGVISQLRPDYEWSGGDFHHKADVIQTQTPINPGNSGGPLFNNEGELIGVNSFVDPEADGLNYAIAVTTVKTFLASDILHKKAKSAKEKEGAMFDRDGDGIDESKAMDKDNNGKMDALFVDTNGDGKFNFFYFDNNENSIAELTVEIISLEDGSEVAVFYYDKDEDEIIESRGYDFDMDGEVDQVEAA